MTSCPAYRLRVSVLRAPRGMNAPPLLQVRADIADTIPKEQRVFYDMPHTIGYVRALLEPAGGIARVVLADARPPRCGIGKAMYARLAQEACRRGRVLRSDTERSIYAAYFWQKQARAGHARYLDDQGRYEIPCPAPRALAGLRGRR